MNLNGYNVLDDLAKKYGTDKSSIHHNYTKVYAALFQEIVQDVTGILELGVGGKNYRGVAGSSLMMWRDYFPKATVVGVDIDPGAQGDYGERVEVVIGDQTRRSVLNAAIEKVPNLDIIVDDGAHINTLTISSFQFLFPKLRPGGFYVIEDTQCGSEMRLGNTRIQMEDFIIEIVRGIETNGRILTKGNSADFDKISKDYILNPLERWVESMTLYRGLYVLKKREK